MKAERIVIDTNIVISAALNAAGTPRTLIDTVIATGNCVLLFSDETFFELDSRFQQRKFDKYVSREFRAVFQAQLESIGEWVAIAGAKLGCRDPHDDKFLETALMGEADCLITGDEDLLVMSPFHGIPILTPRAFLKFQEQS